MSKIGRERSSRCGNYVIVRTEADSVSMAHWEDDEWVQVAKGISRAIAIAYGVPPEEVDYVFSGIKGGRDAN